ncbi:phosphotransferase family protein [Rhodopseudomonas sp. B29]|uniref:phosphotransferase family protein n=1 Tax=Rhodopseudomonas sp. B29 TaxID=95607 RepID=UPI00034B37C8|nr:phosphotransferase [Rhodopseudomonas sp. B29]
MKHLGQAQTAEELRAESVLAGLLPADAETLGYEVAMHPVASPSYQAVESTTYYVAPNGTEANLFLRLGAAEVAELVDHGVALVAARRAADLGLAPAVIGGDAAARTMLLARLGAGWKVAKIDDLITPDAVSHLVTMQKTIAAGAPFGRPWSVFEGIEAIWALLPRSSVPLPDDADWMHAWMMKMAEAIDAAGVDRRPAHGDPHSSNVMLGPNGAMALVDFDMAGDIDPYYQLGVQMNELYQFESQMKPLLELHDGRFSETAFSRCRIYAAADDFYWALRSLLMASRSPLQGVEFLKYAGWRFLRCRMALGKPGFEEFLRTL